MSVAPEFWVMRALLHQGTRRQVKLDHCTPAAAVAVLALVNTGEFALMPDGTICEPVEVYREQLVAEAEAAKLQTKYPDEDFRVIMNVDIQL